MMTISWKVQYFRYLVFAIFIKNICAGFGAKYKKYDFCIWAIEDGQVNICRDIELKFVCLCLPKGEDPMPINWNV